MPRKQKHSSWRCVSALGFFLAACGAGSGTGDPDGGLPTERKWGDKQPQYFVQNFSGDVDIVVVVDNSMQAEQERLVDNLAVLTNVLKANPDGMPNVHIGVVSSSLGAGRFTDVPGCPQNGDNGAFQNAPHPPPGSDTCPVPGGRFIIALEKGMNTNIGMNDIGAVFSCISRLGTNGCDFKHPLGSMRRALGGDRGFPRENEGFLRPDALLAVVILTDGDDCSAPPDSDLFDPRMSGLTDPLGPLTPFRCNEFGHLCGGVRPPRTATDLEDCRSAEDSGKLTRVSDFVTYLKTHKPVPEMTFVAALAGPPTPYSVGVDDSGFPRVLSSCRTSNGPTPAVRLKEVTDAFGENGFFGSICPEDVTDSFDRLGKELGKWLGLRQCLRGVPVDKDPATEGVQANCEVFEQVRTAGRVTTTPLPPCGRSSPPCWTIEPNPAGCVSGHALKVERAGRSVPSGTVVAVICETE